MLVLYERKSRVTLAARLVGKTAAETISVMLAVFARIEPTLRKSITLDNDTAFAQHALLKTMCAMTTWFCDAYASWQKGGVENANGRLRRWLPRQIDIDKVSDEEIQDIILTSQSHAEKMPRFQDAIPGNPQRAWQRRPNTVFINPLHLAPESTLAVPVTASYIICAVIAAPAMIKLGVPAYAAHMFIFYYAVLSEVSPPTALSPFAAAAITGGDPYRTTLQAWKYTLPAFLVPFVFVLDPLGVGLLMTVPKGGSVFDIILITAKTAAGLLALAVAAQDWGLRRNTKVEQVLWVVGGLLLVFPSLLEALAEWLTGYDVPHPAWFGVAIIALLLLKQWKSPAATAKA